MADFPRDLVEKYEILDKIGEGGMGLVYKARHRYLQRFDVVKLIHSRVFVSDEAKKNFIREALTTAQLKNHKNVVTVYGAGGETETPYIIYELIKGTPLDKYIKEKKRLPVRHALFIGREICEGMSYAHSMGIIHRDLKSENILMSDQLEDGVPIPRIADFGIALNSKDQMKDAAAKAKAEAQAQAKTGPKADGKSGPGAAGGAAGGGADDSKSQKPGNWQLFGTPSYMSPEQAEGKEATARSDLYAIGIILFEMISGEVPFKGTALQVIMRHIYDEPPRLNTINNDVPEQVAELVARALAKDPAQRFESAEDMANKLDKAWRFTEKWQREASSGSLHPRSLGLSGAQSAVSMSGKGLRQGATSAGTRRFGGASGGGAQVGPEASGRIGTSLGSGINRATQPGSVSSPDFSTSAKLVVDAVMDKVGPYRLQAMIVACSLGILAMFGLFMIVHHWSSGDSEQAFIQKELSIRQGLQQALVTWKSDEAYPSAIEWGESDDAMTRYAGAPGPETDHRVQVKGVKPGARYYCKLLYPQSVKSLPYPFHSVDPLVSFTWSRLGTKGITVEGDTTPAVKAVLVYVHDGKDQTVARADGDNFDTSHLFRVPDFLPDSDTLARVTLTYPTGETQDVPGAQIKER